MSRKNVELTRALLAAGAAGEPTFADLLDPECEWISDPRVPGGGSYRGRDQVFGYVSGLRQLFETFTFDIHEILELNDGRLLAITTARGRGGLSGADVDLEGWSFLVEWRDGLLVRIQSFLVKDEALEAVGLSA